MGRVSHPSNAVAFSFPAQKPLLGIGALLLSLLLQTMLDGMGKWIIAA